MSNSKKPTIYDVAERSGVSISTISRVLNAPQKVNPATRTRVMSAIDQLGFVPKAEARARALRDTNRIGVLTPSSQRPSFVQRLRGAASALSSANYELVIYPVNPLEHLKGHISSIAVMRALDGLIVMSLALEEKDAWRLLDGIATVLIEYSHAHLNSIVIDDVQGGRLAAGHLIEKVTSGSPSWATSSRAKGTPSIRSDRACRASGRAWTPQAYLCRRGMSSRRAMRRSPASVRHTNC